MDNNKMRDISREQFQEWSGPRSDLAIFQRGHNSGKYKNPVMQKMWEAWQASREAVVVDLPEGLTLDQLRSETAQADPEHERWLTRPGIVHAIEAQGLKVKS